ncbi:MAG TPA: MEDS domain-containing protein [Gemmatimonadales bacterium]|nr:MEDS domain-containing protein [Gemmatimonadales bacterium]
MIGTSMQDGLRAELLDIREAAALLRVSETSLRRWTNAGRLPCLRVGGRRERRFRRADLLAFLSGEGATGHSPSRSHFCGLYTSDLSRVREAAAFLAGGLQPRTLSMLVAAPDVQRAVIELLERDRPATRNDLETGRLTLAEYRDSAPAQLEYWGTRMRTARETGASRVQVVADVSGGGLGRLPFAEILEYEAEYERSIARRFPVTTLCQYDARKISGLEAAGLLQCHDGPA